MGLDISIELKSGIQFVQTLDDDGYFWYLQPFFENMYRKTGENIDLYEYTYLDAADTEVFATQLKDAKRKASSERAEFDVEIGVLPNENNRIIFGNVERDRLVDIIQGLLDACEQVALFRGRLLCLGD